MTANNLAEYPGVSAARTFYAALRTALLVLVGVCVIMTGWSGGAERSPPRLIVRGDDMGFSHAGNEAIVQCFRDGIETTVEVIVPSPWFPEAVALLAKYPDVDVGVHLALTSEWDGIKWRPVSEAPSLCDENGYFYPMVFPNPAYPRRSLRENHGKLEEIEREFRAQIETAQRLIPRVSHVSGHMGCEHLNDDVRALYHRLAKEYRIDLVPDEKQPRHVSYVGPHGSSAEKLSSFLQMLDSLEDGQTYLFVDHPGLNVPELRAIHHMGYEDVAVDRQGVTDTWTHPRVRQHLQSLGIVLISYRDLQP